jgi:RHS repeat-associated protein
MNQDTISSGSYPLYDALFREYHPTWGRWLSPDPAGLAAANPSNPQSWNRYAYVMDNPTTLTDPTGLLVSFTQYEAWLYSGGSLNPGGDSDVYGLTLPSGWVGQNELVACPNNICSGFSTNQYGVTQFYQYWAFAGLAAAANGYYPGLGPLNPDALAAYTSLAAQQNPLVGQGAEIGGDVYEDTRAGIYNVTWQNQGAIGEFGVFLSSMGIPDYGDPLGEWWTQSGATFNNRDVIALPNGGYLTGWVSTPEGTVFKNDGPGTTCVVTGPMSGVIAGETISYSGCN